MSNFRSVVRPLQVCLMLAATLSVASADLIIVHDKSGKLIATPLHYTYVGGIPTLTIQASSLGVDRKIKTGDIELLEPLGTPGGGVPSDLLRFLAGPLDKKGNPTFYSLQFLSDTNEMFDEGGNVEQPVPGDVGFTPDPKAKQLNESDLEFAAADWRLAGTGNPDPNSILRLKGKSGVAYIARCPGVSNPKLDDCNIGGILPFREGPIGYIFVSDTVSTPELSSWSLLATALGIFAFAARCCR